jgi:hypothetical protein
MIGDERVRFCQQCERNVYNISGMSRSEAESLVLNAEGRLCVRFYRRRDGSVLTANCPVGLRSLKERAARAARAFVSAALGLLAGLGLAPLTTGRWGTTIGEAVALPPASVPQPATPPEPPSVTGEMVPVAVVGTGEWEEGQMTMGAAVEIEPRGGKGRRAGRRK